MRCAGNAGIKQLTIITLTMLLAACRSAETRRADSMTSNIAESIGGRIRVLKYDNIMTSA